jgi:hypothetical protein
MSRWVSLNQARAKASEKFLGVAVVAFRNLAVGRVHLHRHVGVGHDRIDADRRILGVDGLVFFG